MNRILILALGATLFFHIGYSQIYSKVDERFELTSTVFALAGVPEYCQCAIPSYLQDMITDLKPYELTDPIQFIRELNQIHRIGYNAVSTTAEMLEIKNGEIRLQPQYDIEKISEANSNWKKELFIKYLKMLNVFYKQSNFHQFFEQHRALYDVAEQQINQLLTTTATGWFESFFGKPLDPKINIYISLCNGPNNYAMPNGVLIGMMADQDGRPNPSPVETMYVLIHELSHHYTNPLFFAHWAEMETAADKMYPYVKDKMAKIAYGDARATFCEWMNNLFTLMYTKESEDQYADEKLKFDIKNNTERGFIWMQQSVDFMDHFYAHRDQYPHIEDFMPQLIAFLNYTADHYDLVIQEFETRHPRVLNVYPAVGSDISNFKEIVLTFSEPMTGSYGFSGIGTDDENVQQLYIDLENIKWSDDKQQITLPLNQEEAKDNCMYGIQLFTKAFTSSRYFRLDDRCKNLLFNTGQK